MNLLFRMVFLLANSFRRPKIEPLESTSLSMRVWPNDLDLNIHMNNGRYLSIMDLGRMDLVIRLGLFKTMLQQKWQPMLGAATIRFRRALSPFAKYQLTTRILCWDAKWFYIEQTFESNNETVAIATVQGLFRGKKGSIPSLEVLAALGQAMESPPIPEHIQAWIQSNRRANLSAASA